MNSFDSAPKIGKQKAATWMEVEGIRLLQVAVGKVMMKPSNEFSWEGRNNKTKKKLPKLKGPKDKTMFLWVANSELFLDGENKSLLKCVNWGSTTE